MYEDLYGVEKTTGKQGQPGILEVKTAEEAIRILERDDSPQAKAALQKLRRTAANVQMAHRGRNSD